MRRAALPRPDPARRRGPASGRVLGCPARSRSGSFKGETQKGSVRLGHTKVLPTLKELWRTTESDTEDGLGRLSAQQSAQRSER